MAANSRSKSTTWGENERVRHTHFETVDANAAKAVARTSTTGGSINYPLVYGGSNSVTNVGVFYTSGGVLSLSNQISWVMFPMDRLPDGHLIESVAMSFTPAAGHTAEPANLPAVRVQKVATGGTATTLGSAAYTWVDTASYHAGFTLTATCGSERIDLKNNRYQIRVLAESDTNSVNGCVIECARVDMTMDTASAGTDLSHWILA